MKFNIIRHAFTFAAFTFAAFMYICMRCIQCIQKCFPHSIAFNCMAQFRIQSVCIQIHSALCGSLQTAIPQACQVQTRMQMNANIDMPNLDMMNLMIVVYKVVLVLVRRVTMGLYVSPTSSLLWAMGCLLQFFSLSFCRSSSM